MTGNHHPLHWFRRFLSTPSFFYIAKCDQYGSFYFDKLLNVLFVSSYPTSCAARDALCYFVVFFRKRGAHSSAVDGATASGNGHIDLNGGAAAGCHDDRADGVCSHLCVPAEDLHSSVRSLFRQRLHGGVVELHPRQLVSVPTQEHLLKPRTFNLHLQLLDFTFI